MLLNSSIPQLIAVGIATLSNFSYGTTLGFITILISELHRKDTEIVVTIAELTWISSVNYFVEPLGALTGGFISRHYGRRNVLSLSSLPFITAWLLLYFSVTSIWLIIGFILLGIANGFVAAPIQVYVAEIAEPKLRGISASFISISAIIGSFVTVLIGSFIYWRTLALINIFVPAVTPIALYFVPYSPYWLVSKGRLDEAKHSLAWLRGWTKVENVSYEFSTILEISESKLPHGNFKYKIRRLFRRSVLLPFLLMIFMFIIYPLGGSVPIFSYAVHIFKILNCPIDVYLATAIMAGLQVLATISMILLVPLFGKRKTTLASVGIAGITMMIVVINTFLFEHQDEDSQYRWIPSTFLILSVFAASFGIKSIPWIMTGEVFPGDVRSEITGIVASISNTLYATAGKVFLYMATSMTLPETFLFCAIVNFIGWIVLYFLMPETEGRTLAEIEKYFEGFINEREGENSWKNIKKSTNDSIAYD